MRECVHAGSRGRRTARRTKDARRDDDDLDDVDRLASVWTSTKVDDDEIIIIIIIIIIIVDRGGGGWMWTRGTIGRRTVVAR